MLYGIGRQAGDGEVGGQTRHRIVGAAVRGRGQQHQAPHAGDAVRGRAPDVRPLLPRARVPGLRRQAAAARGAGGGPGRQEPGRGHRDDRGRRGRALRRPGADRGAGGDRRGDPERGEDPPRLPAQRGARLPDPGSRGGHAVGRRGPAHPAGVAAGVRAVGRDVRARRAVHRPAPARQPAPDRDAAAAARPGQQRAGGRARRRDHRVRRPRDRLRPGRRAPGRQGGRPGHARRGAGQRRVADRALPVGQPSDRGAAGAPARPRAGSSCAGRASTT